MRLETLPLLLADATPGSLGAWSLLPPLLAILLAIVFRRVGWALFTGVMSGSLIVARGDFVEAGMALFRDYLVGDSETVYEHLLICCLPLCWGQ